MSTQRRVRTNYQRTLAQDSEALPPSRLSTQAYSLQPNSSPSRAKSCRPSHAYLVTILVRIIGYLRVTYSLPPYHLALFRALAQISRRTYIVIIAIYFFFYDASALNERAKKKIITQDLECRGASLHSNWSSTVTLLAHSK
jgi:hypothetical protein